MRAAAGQRTVNLMGSVFRLVTYWAICNCTRMQISLMRKMNSLFNELSDHLLVQLTSFFYIYLTCTSSPLSCTIIHTMRKLCRRISG